MRACFMMVEILRERGRLLQQLDLQLKSSEHTVHSGVIIMSKTSEVKVSEVSLEGAQPSTVDASHFISGTPTQQRAFTTELTESVHRCGFVKVINHGLSDELIDELFAWVSVI